MTKNVLRAAAIAICASTFLAALHDVSRAWDGPYYHLPFAARIAGILGPNDLVFHRANAARFSGFPLLGEALQGLLWRAVGKPEAANLVAWSAPPLFAIWLWRAAKAPIPITLLALFAVPLVHLHATSTYVDLPANAACAVVVTIAVRAWAEPASLDRAALWGAGIGAAIAANMKFQLHPIVLAAGVAILARLFFEHRRGEALALIAVSPIVFASAIKNLILHHNPYYPVALDVFGARLPGPEAAYHSSPPWLEHAPRPARFVASILEVSARPFTSRRRWTVDMYSDDPDQNRLGGFFNVYVIALLGLLAFAAARDRSGVAKRAAIAFAAFTLVVSILPQSHELRYYLAWMIALVAIVAWLASRGSIPRVSAERFGVVALVALSCVLAVTRCGYAYASGSTFEEIVREKTDAKTIDGISDGERVCVRRPPWNMLWAAKFHPPKRYVVFASEDDDDGACAGARLLE